MSEPEWKTFDVGTEVERQAASGQSYREFLRVPALSCGIYKLPVGSKDLQSPHDEHEVYYVIDGRGRLRVPGEERPVRPGSILYVPATSDHSFFEIDEDITLLVFFASGGPSGS